MSDPASLSFVSDDIDKRSFWNVTSTGGDWAEDCHHGSQLAEEFLRYLNDDARGSLSILGWIVRDIIGKGSFKGVEVGFFNRISRACIDHPLLRLTAETSVPAFTKAAFEAMEQGGGDATG